MSWKTRSEELFAQAESYPGDPGKLVEAAQTAATLALVEVAERLAVAQETANLLAGTAIFAELPDGTRATVAQKIATRLVGYLS